MPDTEGLKRPSGGLSFRNPHIYTMFRCPTTKAVYDLSCLFAVGSTDYEP